MGAAVELRGAALRAGRKISFSILGEPGEVWCRHSDDFTAVSSSNLGRSPTGSEPVPGDVTMKAFEVSGIRIIRLDHFAAPASFLNVRSRVALPGERIHPDTLDAVVVPVDANDVIAPHLRDAEPCRD